MELSEIRENLSKPEFRKDILESIRENVKVLIDDAKYTLVKDGNEAERMLVLYDRNLERSRQRESENQVHGSIAARQDEPGQSNDELEL